MKNILLYCLCILLLVGCNNNIENKKENKTENQLTEEQKNIIPYLQQQNGMYIFFSQLTSKIEVKEQKAYNEKTKEEYPIWQVSPNYYLRFFKDNKASVEYRYIYNSFAMLLKYNKQMLDFVHLKNNKKNINNINVYYRTKFYDGSYRYVKIESIKDFTCQEIKFYPIYAGEYIIASEKNGNTTTNKKKIKEKPIVMENIYEQEYIRNQIGEAYSIIINGKAIINVYKNNEKIASFSNQNIKKSTIVEKNEILAMLGEKDNVNTMTIQTNRNNNVIYEVKPIGQCEIITLTSNYNDIKTKNADITTWDLSNINDDSISILKEETINTKKKYNIK